MYAKELLPYAISIGIKDTDFWMMTKRTFDAYIEAHELRLKKRDEEMWIEGRYIMSAFETVMSHFGAGLSGKKSDAKYVEKPFTQLVEEQRKLENLTEEEKINYTKQLFMRLEIMQSNFNNSGKEKNG